MREIHVTNTTVALGDKKNREEQKVRYKELEAKETLTWKKRWNKETGEGGKDEHNTANK